MRASRRASIFTPAPVVGPNKQVGRICFAGFVMEPLLQNALWRRAGLTCPTRSPITKLANISSAAHSSHRIRHYHLQLQVSPNCPFPQYPTARPSRFRRDFSSTPAPSSIAAGGLSSCRRIWVQGVPLRQAPHFGHMSSGTRGHSTSTVATAAETRHDTINTVSSTNTDANTSNFNMGDRNILPDHIKVNHYDIVLTNLDFKKWTYNGSVTYARTKTKLPLVAQSLI